jgi:hypothetical protein
LRCRERESGRLWNENAAEASSHQGSLGFSEPTRQPGICGLPAGVAYESDGVGTYDEEKLFRHPTPIFWLRLTLDELLERS